MTLYEEVSVGDSFACGTHRFTAEEIKRFAATYDPQPFHIDEAAAAKTHFGGLCASGWHTAGMMMRHFIGYFSDERKKARGHNEPARPLGPLLGVDDLKWLKPVYAGDEIAFSARIVAKRASASRPGWGIVSIESSGVNQRGEPAFLCTSHFLMAMIGED